MAEGVDGTFLLIDTDALPLDPQEFTAATVMLPVLGKLEPKETTIEVDPCPDVMVAPVGTTQL